MNYELVYIINPTVEEEARKELIARFNGMIELANELDLIADRLAAPDALPRAKKLADVYVRAMSIATEFGSADVVAMVKLHLASQLASRALEVLS